MLIDVVDNGDREVIAMAGTGPAPKDAEQRRNRHAPMRGEWVEIPKRNDAPIPQLPEREEPWKTRTQVAWMAWWSDGASTQWTPADVDNVLYLGELLDLGSPSIANEIRLRMDGLGLTQKGKRDLRWKVTADESGVSTTPPTTKARRAKKTRSAAARRATMQVIEGGA